MPTPFPVQSASHQAQAHWHHYVGGTYAQQPGPIPEQHAPRENRFTAIEIPIPLPTNRNATCARIIPQRLCQFCTEVRIIHRFTGGWSQIPALYSLKASNALPPVRADQCQRDQKKGKSRLNIPLLLRLSRPFLSENSTPFPAMAIGPPSGFMAPRITIFQQAIQRKIPVIYAAPGLSASVLRGTACFISICFTFLKKRLIFYRQTNHSCIP